jgi:5-methylcytosine-specific restriction endonuclease McrA
VFFRGHTDNAGKCCSRACGFKLIARNRVKSNHRRIHTPEWWAALRSSALASVVKCTECPRSFLRGKRSVVCSVACSEAKTLRSLKMESRKAPRRCRVCSVEFSVPLWICGSRGFCSNECREEAHRAIQFGARRSRKGKEKLERPGPVFRRAIAERDQWCCWICGDQTTREWASNHDLAPTLDHVIPLAKGGVHGEENLRLAHRVCNVLKGTEILAEGATAWAAADHPLSLAL